MMGRELVTIKKAHEITGASKSFFHQLVRQKKLSRFRVNSAIYIDLTEFRKLAEASAELVTA